MQQIEPAQLADWLASEPVPLLLDVREDWEARFATIAGSLHVPMHQVPARLTELLEAGRPIICYCHHGMRSLQVAMFLERHGHDAVYNLAGGIDAWSRLIDPSCPRY